MRTTQLFEQVTRQIITAVEAGASTFAMPWHRWGETLAMPRNEASGRPYRGINTLLLWAAAEAAGYSSGRWGTYRQWASVDAQVRKGEKATPIVFWKTVSNDDDVQDEDRGDEPKADARFIARVYSVFNADQVEGTRPARHASAPTQSEQIAAAEGFICGTGANIRHGGDRACYVANIDQIWLPMLERFAMRPAIIRSWRTSAFIGRGRSIASIAILARDLEQMLMQWRSWLPSSGPRSSLHISASASSRAGTMPLTSRAGSGYYGTMRAQF